MGDRPLPERTFERNASVDEYGWRHFGDIYGDHEGIRHAGPSPLVSHYNNQYDPVAGFGSQFLRSGDVRWWTMMEELAAHVIDIDIYHTQEDKWAYNHGLFWHTYHYGDADTATHRSYPRAGSKVIGGGGRRPTRIHLRPDAALIPDGDRIARDGHDSAQYVIDVDDGSRTISDLIAVHRTGPASGLQLPRPGAARHSSTRCSMHRLTRRGASSTRPTAGPPLHSPAEDIATRDRANGVNGSTRCSSKFGSISTTRGRVSRRDVRTGALRCSLARWMLEQVPH